MNNLKKIVIYLGLSISIIGIISFISYITDEIVNDEPYGLSTGYMGHNNDASSFSIGSPKFSFTSSTKIRKSSSTDYTYTKPQKCTGSAGNLRSYNKGFTQTESVENTTNIFGTAVGSISHNTSTNKGNNRTNNTANVNTAGLGQLTNTLQNMLSSKSGSIAENTSSAGMNDLFTLATNTEPTNDGGIMQRTNPGDEPLDEPIPVADGWIFMIMLAVAYAGYKTLYHRKTLKPIPIK